jgi:hypothetical protein
MRAVTKGTRDDEGGRRWAQLVQRTEAGAPLGRCVLSLSFSFALCLILFVLFFHDSFHLIMGPPGTENEDMTPPKYGARPRSAAAHKDDGTWDHGVPTTPTKHPGRRPGTLWCNNEGAGWGNKGRGHVSPSVFISLFLFLLFVTDYCIPVRPCPNAHNDKRAGPERAR